MGLNPLGIVRRIQAPGPNLLQMKRPTPDGGKGAGAQSRMPARIVSPKTRLAMALLSGEALLDYRV